MSDDTPHAGTPAATLVELLRRQAERYGDKVAFRFAPDGTDEHDRLTYRDLDARARAIASSLQGQGAAGRRVLVLCRPGLESIVSFFGCLYAGAVAVTAQDRLTRLKLIVPDAQATFAIATPETQQQVRATVDGLGNRPLQWFTPDAPAEDAAGWSAPDIGARTTALLQYTSGSTRSPKGVMVTHGNLLANLAAIQEAWGGDDSDVAVYWLPQNHDMGLIGGILETIYVGCTTVLMSPAAFITQPMRWPAAISHYRATMTAAPNFAYALCTERSTAEERAELDLSCLRTAMNGAEPVHAEALAAFAEAFAPAGFRPEAFMPVYGLAEATLLVSGGSDSPTPTVHYLDRTALGENRVRDAASEAADAVSVVGCGRVRGGQEVVIVDPETARPCEAGTIGEIWVRGAGVAKGYRGKPDDTERTFRVYLAKTGEGPFLRTGDLGYLRDGELFITGRHKDLIVIGGNNYYPNDIEKTVAGCHPLLLAGRGAAFSLASESGAGDQLVVVHEVDPERVDKAQLNGIVAGVRTAVAKHHRVRLHAVALVAQRQIPVTSSGKVQRSRCRELFAGGGLETVAEWHVPSAAGADGTDPAAAARAAALIRQAVAMQYLKSQQG